MKNIFIFYCLMLLFKAGWAQHASCINLHTIFLVGDDPVCDNSPLIVAFEDDFNGNTLNLSKWDPITGVIRKQSGEWQWYTANNLEVSDGTLKIKSTDTPLYNQLYTFNGQNYIDDFNYSSGEIHSKMHFGFGYYEIRCKLPQEQAGFWPAFWGYAFGISPDEIDVFEFLSKDNNQHMTPHHSYNGTLYQCPTETNLQNYNDYHNFGVYRDGYKIQWYVDGVLKRTDTQFYTMLGQTVDCNNLYTGYEYLDNEVFPRDPMNLVANTAVETGQYAPDGNTSFPASFEIDYIRYYKRSNCAAFTLVQSNISTLIHNFYSGTTVTSSGNVILGNGQQLQLVAKNSITLNPGFRANSGSNFEGHIYDVCSQSQLGNLRQGILDQIPEPEQPQINNVNIYPNPTSGDINLDLKYNNKKKIEVGVYNSLGKEIYFKDLGFIDAYQSKIKLQNEIPGLYIIKIITDGEATFNKIVLTK